MQIQQPHTVRSNWEGIDFQVLLLREMVWWTVLGYNGYHGNEIWAVKALVYFWESHGSELFNPLLCKYVTLKMAFLMVTMAALQAFQTMNIGIDMTYVSTLWSMSTMAFLKTHRFQSAVCALNVLSTAISRYLRLIILTSS